MDKQTEYVEKLSAQIVAWDVQIGLLKDKVDRSTSAEASEYLSSIMALQQKCAAGAAKLQGISQTSADEWDDIKAGSGQVLGEVRSLFSDAITKIR